MQELARGHWIDGEARLGPDDDRFELIDPFRETPIAELPDAAERTVDQAVSAAVRVAPSWGRTSPRERAVLLERLADLLEERLADFIGLETWTTGRPIREMQAQLAILPEWYRYFAAVARTAQGDLPPFDGPYLNYVRRRPLGVVGLITPWNHPLLILTKKLAPALAAGNAVVVKPSEHAPLTALGLARLTAEAGFPAGVLNVVTGLGRTAGARLAGHPRLAKVDLTGGTETGRRIASVAGANLARFTGELGGKAPVIVFEDVPVDVGASAAAFAAFVASGQTCVQGARLLVQRSIFESFIEALVGRARAIRLGDPFDPATQMGPLVSAGQRRRVSDYVELGRDEGCTVVTGGRPSPDRPVGYFYEPTAITAVGSGARIAQEEIFGPVTCVLPFEDEADAIRLGNDTAMGLAASVWTDHLGLAHRVADRLECGIVWVNDHHRIDPSSPWGGIKASGIGRENGLEAWREYTLTQSVIVNVAPPLVDWYDTAAARRLS